MKSEKTIRRRFWLVLLPFILVVAAHGQLDKATLFGTVTDTSGAVIAKASVTMTQTQTNFTRTVVTQDDGSYRAEFLPVGPYTVKVHADGFDTVERTGIVLSVTQQAELNISLKVGQSVEVVQVTSDAPLLNTSNSTLGRTASNVEVDNLPLVNRDTYQLLTLTPGVQAVNNQNTLGFPEEHVFINGSTDGTVGQVTYYLDGGLNMTGLRNTGNVLPNPDAIDEFAVQTNNFNASYGRTSAGVVTVLTKSGTNSLHGSIFEFHRETSFNATARGQSTKTPEHINRFGATLGGPIWKDKTFFFGSYAGLRQVTPQQFTNILVPDAAQRRGDFSENLPTTAATSGPGACATPLNAADRAARANGGKFFVCSPFTHQPYPNNIITDPLDPVAQAVLSTNFLPLPTDPVNGFYSGNIGLPNQTDEFLIKGDHQLTPTHRLTLDYFMSVGHQLLLPSGTSVGTWSQANYAYRQQTANVSDVWTVSSSTVNQIWLSYARMNATRQNLPVESLGDLGSEFNIQGPAQLPHIAVNGWFTLAQQNAGPVAGNNVYGLRDVYSTTKGRHALAIGAEAYLEKDVQYALNQDFGVFSFANSTVPNTTAGQASYLKTGNAMSDLLLGRPNTMSQDAPIDSNANYVNYGFFAQDDWRITPKFTANLGLRYDVQTAATEPQNRTDIYRPGVQSTVAPNAPLGQLFPGDPGVPRSGVGTNYNHISPRLGFTYDPFGNGKTIFHGAAGLFFGTISGNEVEYPSNNQPFSVRFTKTFTHVTSLKNLYSTDCADFAGCVSPLPYVYNPSHPRYAPPSQLIALQDNMRWPYNYQLNFGVQQAVSNTVAISINYVGSLNRKLPFYIDRNYPVYNAASPTSNTTTNVNCRRPELAEPYSTGTACPGPLVPGQNYLSNFYVIQSGQNSNYNALQFSLEKRMTHDLSIKGFYTWSKTLATASMDANNLGNGSKNSLEDYTQPQLDKQRSDNDRRHQFVTSVVWKPNYFLGHGRTMHAIADGWTLTAIVTLQSGQPFTVLTGSDNNADGLNNDRPNILPGKSALVLHHGGRAAAAAQWFDITAYCGFNPATLSSCPGAGAARQDGTVRVNDLDGPGSRNVDASLFRDFGIYERFKLQLRGESTNVFNLTNLPQPSSTMRDER
jgi:outer membrane receptor protein involved in Fe transport